MITTEALRHDLKQVHAEQKALNKEERWLSDQIAARAGIKASSLTQSGRKTRPSKFAARKAVADALDALHGPVTVADLRRESGIGATAIGKYLREWQGRGEVVLVSKGKRQRSYQKAEKRQINVGANGVSVTTSAARPSLTDARERAERTASR